MRIRPSYCRNKTGTKGRLVVCRAALKERPRVGGRGLGGWSETLEGSCLTFTPNTTALHSVPIGRGNLISGFFPFSEIGSGAYGTPPRAGGGWGSSRRLFLCIGTQNPRTGTLSLCRHASRP